MSQLAVNSITDSNAGNTATINGMTPTADSLQGFRNRIINGDMRIDQRNAGASVTPSNGAYTLDRWKAFLTQSSKYTVQQNAGSVTPPTGFSNYLGITSSSAYSVLTGDTFLISQNIEGFNFSDAAFGTAGAKTTTLSFWVYSSLTGTFGGALVNSASNLSYPFEYVVSSANTWEQKSITIAGPTTGTWVGSTNGIGLIVRFGLGSGSTFTATAGSWGAGNIVQPTGSVSVVGTSGATFYITGVQLEVGSVATPFERRPYGTELSLCQRYYYRDTAPAPNSTMHSAMNVVCNSTTTAYCYGTFPVIMRAAPTAVEQTGTASNYNIFVNNASVTLNAVPAFALASTRGASVLVTAASGFVLNATGILRGASGAYLAWSAEL